MIEIFYRFELSMRTAPSISRVLFHKYLLVSNVGDKGGFAETSEGMDAMPLPRK